MIARQFPKVRFLAWVHDVAACNPDLAPVPAWVRKAHARFEYVAVSELRRRQWREVSGKVSRVIPNGVDPARVSACRRGSPRWRRNFPSSMAASCCCIPTRLLRRKNVELSLAVVAALAETGRSATLLVTGAADSHNAASAKYAAWLRDECERLEAGAVFVADHFPVNDAELAGLYRLADALIFPSRQEGFGLPLPEAALHRLPVFCSHIEPLRELAGKNAILFSPTATARSVAPANRQMPGKRRRLSRPEASPGTVFMARHLPALPPRTSGRLIPAKAPRWE
jgi:glycosyltransferase involved in cell wall biosynthesis